MAGVMIAGDLSNVSEQQLGFIIKFVEKQGFQNANVVFEAVGKSGDNYVGIIKRIIVKGNDTVLKIIAKIAPNVEAMRLFANTELIFRNEIILYTKILPKFEQLQALADVPPEDRLRFAACYGCCEADHNEIILLEDLNESGFEMLDRFEPLNSDCVKSVLKNLASLHALSYVLKQKEPELFEEYKNRLTDMWSILSERGELSQIFAQGKANITMVLENDVYKKLMNEVMTEAIKSHANLLKISRESKYSVIVQGDTWTNNILFKIDKNPPSSILIDYQGSRVATPVSDLHYMIFICTDHKTRKDHYTNWMDYYHEHLNQKLSIFGLSASYIYPRDQFDADLRTHGKMSLALSAMIAGNMVRKADDAAQMMEAIKAADSTLDPTKFDAMMKFWSVDTFDTETLALFKAKVIELIDSHIEFGYL